MNGTPSPPIRDAAHWRRWGLAARWRRWGIAAIGLQSVLFGFVIAGTHGWIVPLSSVTTTDFASFYAAGKLAAGADPALVYDLARHYQAELAATGSGADYKFFFYPPVFLLLLAPLARLPYLAAFLLFEGGSLGVLLLVSRQVIGRRWTGWALLAAPSLYWCLGQGQNSLVSAALLLAGLGLLDRRPLLAGAAFAALCYKPHLCLVLPFVLIAGRHWRCLFAAGVFALGLVMASVACFGARCWAAFWQRFQAAGAVFASGRVHHGGLVSLYGAALNLGAPPALAAGLQIAATLIAIAVAAAIWRRRGDPARRGAALIAATLIAMPVVLYYDLAIAAPAAMWLVGRAASRRRQNALLTCFAIDLIGYPVALGLHVSIAAAICPILLFLAVTI